MEEQLSLFSRPATPEPSVTGPPGGKTLSDWAFLYTAGRAGHNTGIRFMMSREDAVAWCESDLSHGNVHGNPWAYFFTSVENFCNCHWGQLKGVTLDLRKLTDNGQWDEKISGLGLTKYGKGDIRKILEPYGIRVLI
ncbi:MAG: hypothetical protein LUC39_02935 [Clostridiales bacterium]|nr:hypothetical protein [Clostridiales bacterium]MCD8383897.1 hypothetical protein [Clostridiales bacterium]